MILRATYWNALDCGEVWSGQTPRKQKHNTKGKDALVQIAASFGNNLSDPRCSDKRECLLTDD